MLDKSLSKAFAKSKFVFKWASYFHGEKLAEYYSNFIEKIFKYNYDKSSNIFDFLEVKKGIFMNSYTVKYQRPSSSSVISTVVRASSASQAKEQIKSRFNGDVKIISCVER